MKKIVDQKVYCKAVILIAFVPDAGKRVYWRGKMRTGIGLFLLWRKIGFCPISIAASQPKKNPLAPRVNTSY